MTPARILCVDDEPFILMMLAHCVEDMGHSPIEAANGEEAIEILDSTKVDLLITDIRLGGIDGWEVAERARAATPTLPVVYISGFPTVGKSVAGATYLAKPFRPRELVAAVRQQLAQLTNA